MKKTFALGLVVMLFFSACNSGENNTDTATSDTSRLENSGTAAAMGTDTGTTGSATTGTGNTASASSFHDVMNKMMQDMHAKPMTNDPDHDFATMMKEHHEGAIEMSQIELSQGTDAELKKVAQKIIDDARKDINDLEAFLSSHQPSKQSDFSKKAMDKMMKMSSDTSMNHSGPIDQQFAMMMTMHHQQGVDMARDYLKAGKEEQPRKVANNTIRSNTEDIQKLKKWQSGTGAQTDHSGHQK